MRNKIKNIEGFFMTGNSLTVLDCFNLFQTFELRKIVCVLKAKGLNIKSEWQSNIQTKTRYKKYYLSN
jgi:hypothetical protein